MKTLYKRKQNILEERYNNQYKKFILLKFKKEKEFQEFIWSYAKKEWFWYYKFPDVWASTKPFDCQVRTKKFLYHCELKYERRVNLKIDWLLLDHQIWNLTKLHSLWEKTMILVYHKHTWNIHYFTIDDLLKEKIITKDLSQIFY